MLFVVLVAVGMIFVVRQLLLQRRITARQATRRRLLVPVSDRAADGPVDEVGMNDASDTALVRGRGQDA